MNSNYAYMLRLRAVKQHEDKPTQIEHNSAGYLLDVGWKSCCDEDPFMALCPMAREATWLAAALEVTAAAAV